MSEWDMTSGPPEFLQKLWLHRIGLFVCYAGWLLNYIITIRTAQRERISGVSLVSICNNTAWEFLFSTYYHPPHRTGTVVFAAWMLADVGVLWASVKYAPTPATNPFRRYTPALAILVFLGCLSGHVAMTRQLGLRPAFFYGGWISQALLSGVALALLIQRGHTRGTCWAMWYLRLISSSGAILTSVLRSLYWPAAWGWADSIMMRWLWGAFYAMESLYGFLYWYLKGVEAEAEAREGTGRARLQKKSE
ncbi:hypothetical protein BJY01DRAFT_234112 [Aspergillus pseudoustus]|uniref:Uncharacterized protein n=1 Tax=Aspergillus pseudoustus TaxID=1810923 RepID=A0ABR4K689_9EURO